jgi:hypothetical protein
VTAQTSSFDFVLLFLFIVLRGTRGTQKFVLFIVLVLDRARCLIVNAIFACPNIMATRKTRGDISYERDRTPWYWRALGTGSASLIMLGYV